MNFFRRKILVLGMAAVACTGLLLIYFVWKGLIHREAIGYAKQFTVQIRDVVAGIDKVSQQNFTAELYGSLHRQRLAEIPRLTRRPPLDAILQEAKTFFQNSDIEMSLFTDCHPKNTVLCYHDSDMDSAEPQFPDPNAGSYDPKSRPLYLATRAHTDWILLNFMLLGKTLITGYPPAYGVALVKRFLFNETKSGNLENGIWLSLRPKGEGWTSFLVQGREHAFDFLDVSFHSLRFSKELLSGQTPLEVTCNALSDFSGLISYRATVPCLLNGETLQFLFSKKYDHPITLAVLLLALTGLLYVAFLFFSYVEKLQEQNIQKAAISAVGARLVHDLKKGIVTQLDNLYQEFGSDFEREAERPDFKERLQSKLKHHFFYLEILHKYMNLLTNNLKRKQEETWVPLTPRKFKEYLSWILGPTAVTAQEVVLPSGQILECRISAGIITCKQIAHFPEFSVPEMAFYRILKNLWENFNTYGTGDFLLSLEKQAGGILLRAINSLATERKTAQESTHLGMVIIKQLLEDNFGPHSRIHQKQKEGLFVLEIFFPC